MQKLVLVVIAKDGNGGFCAASAYKESYAHFSPRKGEVMRLASEVQLQVRTIEPVPEEKDTLGVAFIAEGVSTIARLLSDGWKCSLGPAQA